MQRASGVGVGFRLGLADALLRDVQTCPAQFLEISPENYLNIGGKRRRLLQEAAERWPVLCHGLCGDFAGSAPLDREFLRHLRTLLQEMRSPFYSDHLCLTTTAGTDIHDLVPLPFTDESVQRCAVRLRELQDILEMPIAVENVSAYLRMPTDLSRTPSSQTTSLMSKPAMSEADFINAVVKESGCSLLLDVNNVYVNAVNFGFDAYAFIDAMPLDRVVEIHMAGHWRDEDEKHGLLLIDTHGEAICDEVYALYAYTLQKLSSVGKRVPTLLERDHNIPSIDEIFAEITRLQEIETQAYAHKTDTHKIHTIQERP